MDYEKKLLLAVTDVEKLRSAAIFPGEPKGALPAPWRTIKHSPGPPLGSILTASLRRVCRARKLVHPTVPRVPYASKVTASVLVGRLSLSDAIRLPHGGTASGFVPCPGFRLRGGNASTQTGSRRHRRERLAPYCEVYIYDQTSLRCVLDVCSRESSSLLPVHSRISCNRVGVFYV